MADPPQMAVPAEISVETLRSIPSRLPRIQPKPKVVTMDTAAKSAPCKPVRKTIGKSIPKPRKTTEICNSFAETFLPKCGNGFSCVSARNAPSASATGGEVHGVRQSAAATIKITCGVSRQGACG